MSNVLTVSLDISLSMMGIALILTCYRLFKGPTLPDRVIALDLVSGLSIGMIAAYCILTGEFIYIRAAIVLAVMSFLGTVAFAYYVGKGGLP